MHLLGGRSALCPQDGAGVAFRLLKTPHARGVSAARSIKGRCAVSNARPVLA